MLESSYFERSGTLKKLLVYLWLNREETVSEYAVATEALGRKADFDPKTDATVRVQIARLRVKLKEFYEGEGAQYPLLIQIPKGSHTLEVSERLSDQISATEEPATVAVSPRGRYEPSPLLLFLGAGCIVLSMLCLWLMNRPRDANSGMNGVANTSARAFWQSILDGPQRTRIVLPTPDFFYFESDNTRIRDLSVNDYANWRNSHLLEKLSEESKRPPQLDHSYTVRADTFAAISLARYLDSVGLGQKVDFVDSAQAPAQSVGQTNQVVFGTYTSLYPYKNYLDRMNFFIGPHENEVFNRQPAPGEQKLYEKVFENGEQRTIQPGIIALLPGTEGGTRLLILQATYTSALTMFLTSSTGIDQLEKLRKAQRFPQYYEVVVFAEMDGDRPIRVWPVVLHSFVNYTK